MNRKENEMIHEPTEATKIAKKLAGALEALAEIIRNIEDPEQGFEIKCVVPEDLALLAGMFAAVHSAPGRPSIVETWKGPGFYRVALRCGASQSQDFDKLDDLWVEVVKTEERLPVFDEADDEEWLHPEKEDT